MDIQELLVQVVIQELKARLDTQEFLGIVEFWEIADTAVSQVIRVYPDILAFRDILVTRVSRVLMELAAYPDTLEDQDTQEVWVILAILEV